MGCRFGAFSGAGFERDGVPVCAVLYSQLISVSKSSYNLARRVVLALIGPTEIGEDELDYMARQLDGLAVQPATGSARQGWYASRFQCAPDGTRRAGAHPA